MLYSVARALLWIERNTSYLDLLPIFVQLLLVFPPISGQGGLSPIGSDVRQGYAQPPRQGPQELLVSGEAVHRQGQLLVLVEGSGGYKVVAAVPVVAVGAVTVRVVRVDP